MGGKSSSASKSTSATLTNPWGPAIPQAGTALASIAPQWSNTGLSGTETTALDQLHKMALGGNEFAPAIGQVATDLLKGGTDRTGMVSTNLDDYRTALQPFATGSTNPWENADFTRMVGNVSDDAMNKVKAQYEAAGYNPSAASFGRSVGEGVSKAVTPLAYQASNDLTNRKLGAINSLYGAGNTTAGLLSMMDQAALGNRQAGVDVAGSAKRAQDAPWMRLLELENQKFNTPVSRIASLEQLLLPIAQLGGTSQTDSVSQASKTASPVEVAQGWASVGKSLFGQGGMFGGSGAGWSW